MNQMSQESGEDDSECQALFSTYFVRACNHPRKLGVFLAESPCQCLHDRRMIRAEIDEDMADAGLFAS